MCRLVAYLGHEVLLEEVLVKPINSIVMQSLHARETSIPTNGDGFGLGWYVPDISDCPALFTSIAPAWNDNNLLHLTAKIKSPNFFAHVRAASSGGVTQFNCHPFIHGKWMLMHNGEINDFIAVKRHMCHLLDDDVYNWVKGASDSEHFFGLLIQLAKGRDLSRILLVADLLEEAFEQVATLQQQFCKPGPSFFNICLTDGKRLIATRYCTDKTLTPESMHYSVGCQFVNKDGHFHLLKEGGKRGSVLVTSEKLTDFNAEWQVVPANHMMIVDADLSIQLRPL